MLKNKNKIFFDDSIKKVLEMCQETSFYLLLSLENLESEKNLIYDIIKVPNLEFKKDFQDLLMFFLPYGMKVIGGLYFISNISLDDSSFVADTVSLSNVHEYKNNFLLEIEKLYYNSSYYNSDYFYFAIINKAEYPNLSSSKTLNFKSNESLFSYLFNKNNKKLEENMKIKIEQAMFKDLSYNVYKDFLIFSLNSIDYSMQMNNVYNVLDEGLYKSILTQSSIKIKDLNKIIHSKNKSISNTNNNSSILSKLKKNLVDKFNEEEELINEEFFEKEGIIEYFSNNREISLSLSLNSSFDNDEYEETNNTFINLTQSNAEDQIIKSIKLNFYFIISRKRIEFSSDFFEQMKEYFINMIIAMHNLNISTTYTYSIYGYLKSNSLPFYVLYTKKDKIDEFEENLLPQRKYFMELHSIDIQLKDIIYPKLKVKQLEGHEDWRYNLEEKEFPNKSNKISGILLSPHLEIFYKLLEDDENIFSMVKGDYLFYHSGHQEINDSYWGRSYRACQTIMTWLFLNGHVNLEVPFINSMQEILIFLGERRINFLNSNTPLNLNDIGMILAYYIDAEIDILGFKNSNELMKNIEVIENHFNQFGSPIILEKVYTKESVFNFSGANKIDNTLGNIVTIFGICLEKNLIGILDHDYNKSDSLLYLKKSEAISFKDIEESLFPDDEANIQIRYNILLLKPPFTI